MQDYYELLEEILKRKKQGNFKCLKEKLGIDSDEMVMQILISYLDFSIENFNFNTVYEKNKNLKKVISYLNYNRSMLLISDQGYKDMYRDLTNVSNKIEFTLENPGHLCNQNHVVKNIFLLQKIKGDINTINQKLSKKGLSNDINGVEMYNFVLALLDNTNSYDFIYQLVKDNPSIVNLKVSGNYLIEHVIDKFGDCFISEKNYHDKLFYEKIIRLFVLTPSFNVDSNVLKRKFSHDIKKLKKGDSKTYFEKQGEICLINEVAALFDSFYKCQDNNEDMNDYLRTKYQLEFDFTDLELNELEMLIKPDLKEYKDHRNLKLITIDSPETNRFEDALYLSENEDGYLFRLYSSDASSFIFDNFSLENRAYNHAMNYFLPDNVINDYLSLKNGMDIYAICYEFLLDNNYDVKDVNVYKAIVNVSDNLNYGDVKKSMKNGNEEITNLYVFASNLNLKRLNKEIKDRTQILNNLGTKGNYNIGPFIISELSSFTNYTLANSFELPFICRKRSLDEEIIEADINVSFSDELRKNEIMHTLKKSKTTITYYSAIFDKKYADFCSPVRKSDALWNQKVLISKDNPQKLEEYQNRLLEVCNAINDKSIRNKDYEAEVKINKQKFLKKVDKKYKK